MLLHLIRKDILLAKRYVFIALAVIIVIPLFFMRIAPALSGFIGFLYMVVVGGLVLLQAVSQEEGKYPKAVALLCAAPYRRSLIVAAKYVAFLLIFAYSYAVYTLTMLISNPDKLLDLTSVLAVLLIGAVMFGVYMPVEVKYGFVKARFLFMTIIILFSIGPRLFRNLLSGIDFSAFASMPVYTQNKVMAISTVIILGISMIISIRIFIKKEL